MTRLSGAPWLALWILAATAPLWVPGGSVSFGQSNPAPPAAQAPTPEQLQSMAPEQLEADRKAMQQQLLVDFGDLAHYAEANAALPAPGSAHRVVFMGDSI